MLIESMYYQFTPQSKMWNEDRKELLARTLGYKLNLPISNNHISGDFPFIQMDRYGSDVTISRITRMSEEAIEKMVKKADKIFDEVMS